MADLHNITPKELVHQIKKEPFNISNNHIISQKIDCIYQNILKLHEICHSKGIITGVVTLPDVKFEINKFYSLHLHQRKRLNKNLRKFSEENPQNTVFVDLAYHIPYINTSTEFRRNYWSDGLHFSQQGYDKMGRFIYSKLKYRKFV